MLYIGWTADAEAETGKASYSYYVSRDKILRPELAEEGIFNEEMNEHLIAASLGPAQDDISQQTPEKLRICFLLQK